MNPKLQSVTNKFFVTYPHISIIIRKVELYI